MTAMSDPGIHIFNHSAMATQFQVRIAGEEKTYAAQVAQTAFALIDNLESKLSRFQENSEISHIATLAVGEQLRLTEPVFACLNTAQKMEAATGGAFSITAAALKKQSEQPLWALLPAEFSIRCERGQLEFDLGAIGKGFALDRVAQLMEEWSCPAYLLVAGGSSILAGEPPPGKTGWNCGLGTGEKEKRYLLKNESMSSSGIAAQGRHILDPRNGQPATTRDNTWAMTDSATESDALSTAAMVLSEAEIAGVVARNPAWLVFLRGEKDEKNWRQLGQRPMPPVA